MRFITPKVHGYMDYLIAVALIAGPFVLFPAGTDPVVFWLPVIAGAGLIGYSLLTDMSASARKLSPFKLHLLLDLSAVLGFLALPFILGMSGTPKLFYLAFGAAGLLFVVLTNPNKTANS
jgi:hypothetical protein